MGGFVLETAPRHDHGELLKKSPRLVLTRIGLNYMIEHQLGTLPEIDAQNIKDMGTADSLAKLLVCFQATWMIVQSISRRATEYPVSFLKFNPVSHAACALLMYLFWFRKPKDIKIQTAIRFEGVDKFTAFLYFGGSFEDAICAGSADSAYFLYGHDHDEENSLAAQTMIGRVSHAVSEVQREAMRKLITRFQSIIRQITSLEQNGDARWQRPRAITNTVTASRDLLKSADPLRKRSFGHLLQPQRFQSCWEQRMGLEHQICPHSRSWYQIQGHKLSCLWKKLRRTFQRALEGPIYDWHGKRGGTYNLTPEAFLRLDMVADFLQERINIEVQHLTKESCSYDQILSEPPVSPFQLRNGVVLEASNWPTPIGSHGWSIAPQLGIALVTFSYGCFHALALFEQHPTHLERYMWMASCVCLVCSGISASTYAMARELLRRNAKRLASNTPESIAATEVSWLVRFVRWVVSFNDATLESSGRHFFFLRKFRDQRRSHRVPALLLRLFVWIGALLAVCARIFIVVEAFISLHHMPYKMYKTPNWPNWIPHL